MSRRNQPFLSVPLKTPKSRRLPSWQSALLVAPKRWHRWQRVDVLQARIVERALDGLRDQVVSGGRGVDVMELRVADPGEVTDVIGHEGVAAEGRVDIYDGDAKLRGVGGQVVVDQVDEVGGVRALAREGVVVVQEYEVASL